MFFANRQRGLPLDQCPDNDNHNVDTQDGLTIVVPVALASATQPEREADQAVMESAQILRRSRECARYGAQLNHMIRDLLSEKSLAAVLQSVGGQGLERTLSSPDPVVA